MEFVKVSIPLDSGSFEARIDPARSYGGVPGSELIDKYSNHMKQKPQPQFIPSIQWDKEKVQGCLTANNNMTIAKGNQQDMLNLEWTPKGVRTFYKLSLPCGQFPKSVRINKSLYDPRLVSQILEDITHRKILCRRGDRSIKQLFNVSLEVSVIADDEQERPLVIFGKNGIAYLLAPIIEE
jgi:hypothetical protein